MAVEKGAIATEIANDALAILLADAAMPPRHAWHLLAQLEIAFTACRFGPKCQRLRIDGDERTIEYAPAGKPVASGRFVPAR